MLIWFGPDDDDLDSIEEDEDGSIDEEDRDPAEILNDDVDESVYGDE